jgi:alpha-tubulin suppressor-like RCC1 family protein
MLPVRGHEKGSTKARQLGDRTTTSSSVPVAVGGLSGATALAAGYKHTCAVLADATVRCWGGNTDGELGDGTGSAGSRAR